MSCYQIQNGHLFTLPAHYVGYNPIQWRCTFGLVHCTYTNVRFEFTGLLCSRPKSACKRLTKSIGTPHGVSTHRVTVTPSDKTIICLFFKLLLLFNVKDNQFMIYKCSLTLQLTDYKELPDFKFLFSFLNHPTVFFSFFFTLSARHTSKE